MSIKITVQDAIAARVACDTLNKKVFPAKVSFKLIKLLKELSVIEKTFSEVQNLTIFKYAEKDVNGEIIKENLEDGNTFIPIALENREKCNRELKEALEQEVEVSDIYFDIEDFGEEKISPEELMGLFPFILD